MKNQTLTIAALEAQAASLEQTLVQFRLAIAQLRDDAQESADSPSTASKLMLSVKEAADYTGLSEWVIRQLARDRKIAATWFGRTIRIPRRELDRYCAALTGTES